VLRENRLRAKLRAGERAYGIMATISSPDLLEFLGHFDFDFAFLDAEHGAIGVETTRELVRACNWTNMTPLVRVPKNDPTVILGFLEAGAEGIIIPHCIGAADVEAAVSACRYPPVGRRGGFSGSRVAHYGLTQTAPEYFEWADREILVCPQIEDAPALAQLDAMMQVPGVDMFVIGPGDLGLSMGIRGQWFHPDVQAGIDAVCEAGRRNGKWVSTLALNPDDGRKLFERGCHAAFIAASTVIANGTRAFLEPLKQ
jgi:4-hydroxy-2-oxoheptanedioate aldolase